MQTVGSAERYVIARENNVLCGPSKPARTKLVTGRGRISGLNGQSPERHAPSGKGCKKPAAPGGT